MDLVSLRAQRASLDPFELTCRELCDAIAGGRSAAAVVGPDFELYGRAVRGADWADLALALAPAGVFALRKVYQIEGELARLLPAELIGGALEAYDRVAIANIDIGDRGPVSLGLIFGAGEALPWIKRIFDPVPFATFFDPR